MAINDSSGSKGWPSVNYAMDRTNFSSKNFAINIPRNKYTHLVEFIVNPSVLDADNSITNLKDFLEDGKLYTHLTSIDYPQPTMNIEKMRSYNKWINVPTKVEYNDASMTFYDDSLSVIQTLYKEYVHFYEYTATIGQTISGVLEGQPSNITGAETDSYLNTEIDGSFTPILLGAEGRDEMRTLTGLRPSLGLKLKTSSMRHFFDAIVIYDLGTEPHAINVHWFHKPVITSWSNDRLDKNDRNGLSMITASFGYEGFYWSLGVKRSQLRSIIQDRLGFFPENDGDVIPKDGIGQETQLNRTGSPTVLVDDTNPDNLGGFDENAFFDDTDPENLSDFDEDAFFDDTDPENLAGGDEDAFFDDTDPDNLAGADPLNPNADRPGTGTSEFFDDTDPANLAQREANDDRIKVLQEEKERLRNRSSRLADLLESPATLSEDELDSVIAEGNSIRRRQADIDKEFNSLVDANRDITDFERKLNQQELSRRRSTLEPKLQNPVNVNRIQQSQDAGSERGGFFDDTTSGGFPRPRPRPDNLSVRETPVPRDNPLGPNTNIANSSDEPRTFPKPKRAPINFAANSPIDKIRRDLADLTNFSPTSSDVPTGGGVFRPATPTAYGTGADSWNKFIANTDLQDIVEDRVPTQIANGNTVFGQFATKNADFYQHAVIHRNPASAESTLNFINKIRGDKNTGYHAVAENGRVFLAAPPGVRVNGTGKATVPGQGNRNTFHMALIDNSPQTLKAAERFSQQVLVNQFGIQPNNFSAHGTASNRQNSEGVAEVATIKSNLTPPQ